MVSDLELLALQKRDAAFYERDALDVARGLLGDVLVHVWEGEVHAGRIVETEAYRGPKDLACHARVGLTRRTRTLLGPAGHAYVYLIYGMYDCFNVVCGGADQRGHAVLVRAVEPVLGICGRRTDGPGRLSRAMGITRALDGVSLLSSSSLFVAEGARPRRIAKSARIGVGYAGRDAERAWRLYDAGSAHVSRLPSSPRTTKKVTRT